VAALFPEHSFEVAAMSPVNSTINHDETRRWVASRKGHPAFVKSTRKGDSGLLRVDFREPEEGFEEIGLDQFFGTFEESNLAFLYQDETANGRKGPFMKLVDRSKVEDAASEDEDDEDELSPAEEADEDDADEDFEEDDDDDEDEDDFDEDDDEDLDDDDDDDDDDDEDFDEDDEEDEVDKP
jgi:hypothetical protein